MAVCAYCDVEYRDPVGHYYDCSALVRDHCDVCWDSAEFCAECAEFTPAADVEDLVRAVEQRESRWAGARV
jgi:hypothetical protein